MVDLDELVEECRLALADERPAVVVKDVLERQLAGMTGDDPAVPDDGVRLLHRSDELTVLHVRLPPGLPSTLPHDHRMWAVVGVYGGQEDNAFYRRAEGTIVPSGGRSLRPGDVLAMGAEVVHAICNPTQHESLCAFHVYGGDLVAADRSMWLRDTLEERPYDDRVVIGGAGIR